MADGSQGGSTLLVAEDDVLVRNFVRLLLERAGFQVLTAANGLEALEIARNHVGKLDLLLTDVDMPGMRGPVLAQHIMRELPDTKILVMSSEENDWVDKSGTPFLSKPFPPKMLVATITRLIGGSVAQPTHIAGGL